MECGYITHQGAQNIQAYKYAGVDNSILANLLMKHYWNWCIDHIIPKWVAPNTLTLIGGICNCVSFGLMCYWDESEQTPAWVYVLIAVLVFLYQTLDNLDGKQARKTGTSSPLGECFDHGVDAISCPMLAVVVCWAAQLGPTMTFFSMLFVSSLFYLAHWEYYFTGSLILRPLSNPTEAQLGMIGILLLTALFGEVFWFRTVAVPLLGMWQIREIFFAGSFIAFLTQAYDHISTTYSTIRRNGGIFRPAILFCIPFAFFVLFSILWGFLSEPQLIVFQPKLYCFTMGLLLAWLVIRIIVQTVCKEPFKLYYNVNSPIVLFTLHSLFARVAFAIVDESVLLIGYAVVMALHLAVLCISLVQEFSFFLKIYPFSITTPYILPTVAESTDNFIPLDETIDLQTQEA